MDMATRPSCTTAPRPAPVSASIPIGPPHRSGTHTRTRTRTRTHTRTRTRTRTLQHPRQPTQPAGMPAAANVVGWAPVATPTASAVFIDLDRTLLAHASGLALNRALVDEGVLPQGRSLPGDKLLYGINDRLGENLVSMGLVRAAARVAKGWRQDQVRQAGKRAVAELTTMVAPFAPQYLDEFRQAGHKLVLATTTPADMITPFAEAMGFDDVIATMYETNETGATPVACSRASYGGRASSRRSGPGRRITTLTWPSAMPAATASSIRPCSPRSAIRTPSIPTRA